MGNRVEKREKEIRSIRNEIYQVVGFSSAFQGLLLTAVAQSNLLHWNNGGYSLALSAFATGIAAIGAVQKNTIISAWKETNKKENPARKVPCFCLFWIILKVFNRSQFFQIHTTSGLGFFLCSLPVLGSDFHERTVREPTTL